MSDYQPASRPDIFYGWTIVGVCFLALNFSTGIVFMGYPPLILTIQEQFGTSRALASSGPSVASISLGIIALFMGGIVQKFSAKWIMTIGTALISIGFLIISLVDNIYVLLATYGIFIGTGYVSMGIVTGSTLITRWFKDKRGLALGIINLSPGMVLFPLLTSYILVNYGLKAVFQVNALLFALLIPIMLLVVNRPEDRGLLPLGADPGETPPSGGQQASASAPAGNVKDLLTNSKFWLLSLGIAILTGAANVISSQAIPMLRDAGVPQMTATSAISLYGLAIALAAPAFGVLVDKIGALRCLLVEFAIVVVPWVLIAVLKPEFMVFATLLFVIGIANGGIVVLHSSSAAALFKPEQFSRVMGISYFIKMPFLVFTVPAAAHVYDVTGSYQIAIVGGVVSIVIAGVLFAALQFSRREKIPEEAALTKA